MTLFHWLDIFSFLNLSSAVTSASIKICQYKIAYEKFHTSLRKSKDIIKFITILRHEIIGTRSQKQFFSADFPLNLFANPIKVHFIQLLNV